MAVCLLAPALSAAAPAVLPATVTAPFPAVAQEAGSSPEDRASPARQIQSLPLPSGPAMEIPGLCADWTDGPFTRTAADLYCMDLLPAAAGGDARGVVELGRVPGPYGMTVTPEGHHVHRLTAWIEGLPDPSELGEDFRGYVAWLTTPRLHPVERLGTVREGRNDLGRVGLDKFLVLISAEENLEARERSGPLVLRGRSPAMLMEPHDLLGQAPAALRTPPPPTPPGEPEDEVEEGWRMPPMYPDLPMLPGVHALEPTVAPLELESAALDVLGPDALEDLPEARPARIVDLPDGGTLDLEAGLVRRSVAGRDLVMLAFNEQYPGPMIRVPEDATIFVNFTNRAPLPSSVHWHGVRLENRFDGVPGVTQEPVMPGETFRYRVHFRDPGIYWYHPHHREDIQQGLGLYGNILVNPPPETAYNPVNREEMLILDDLLLDDEGVVPFGDERANFALMGRFGNVMLVNGEREYDLEVDRGSVVRFHLTNASQTRTFNLSFRPAGDHDRPGIPPAGAGDREDRAGDEEAGSPRMKVVGSDIGKFEREEWVESVVLAPAERYTVEVLFDGPGTYELVNHVQAVDHLRGVFLPEETVLGSVAVDEEPADPDLRESFRELREHPEVVEEIDRYRPHFQGEPDLELVMDMEVRDLPTALDQVMAFDWIYFHPVEWAGTMPMMNWATSGNEVRWILRDPDTGKENMDIDWEFEVGDVVRVRVHNERDAFHAMQHPLHVHGQRFLVLSQNGVPNENLVWKDTALLPVGSTTDILLEISNPGRWMVHCHVAEHMDAGMKFVMDVEEPSS